MSQRPTFSVLDQSEIDALLERHHVGRLAYSRRDRVDIEPIHYVFRDGWIYARTQLGTKLSTIIHNPWVAMEVDEIRGMFDWESVVVRGRLQLLDENAHAAQQKRYALAVQALRTLVPSTLTEDDPTPERGIICALHVDESEGRQCSSAGTS